MEEDKDLGKESVSRDSAYIYLKTLIEKSYLFKQKVADLRKNLGVSLKAPEGSLENDQFAITYLKWWDKKRNPPDLSHNQEFVSLCNYYYIPEQFRVGLAYYIWNGNSEKLLNDKIKVITSNSLLPKNIWEEEPWFFRRWCQ